LIPGAVKLTLVSDANFTLMKWKCSKSRGSQLKIFSHWTSLSCDNTRSNIEEAIKTDQLNDVSSREGIINMHSLVTNQFDPEAYIDMSRYAWRNTDPAFPLEELAVQPVPPHGRGYEVQV